MHRNIIEKKIFYEKNAPQARYFNETKCAAGKTYQTKCAAGQFFWLNPDEWPVRLTLCVFYFSSITIQNSESSSLISALIKS